MEYKSVFFAKEGEKGLNETSASHLCALASQVKARYESVLKNVSFVDSFIDVVGSDANPKQTNIGMKSIEIIDEAIKEIGKLNAFISWFAEAREVLENIRKTTNRIDLYSWMEASGIEKPEEPVLTSSEVKNSTLDSIINELSVKDRQMYLALEAKASVYGKFIHPDQPMDRARNRMHEVVSKPYVSEGRGRDTIIYHHVPSIDTELVDAEFNKLQAEYRKIEQQLNHMKSDLRKKLSIRNTEENNERNLRLQKYKEERAAYDNKMCELTLQYNQWMLDENTKYYVNPTGRFVIGGPQGDSGLTGRKIIVDTYGGSAPHGGGAFSGKDPTKVDRSAAYASRYVAKNIVAAGLADKCLVQLAYAIGIARPVSVMVDTYGTGKVSDEKLAEAVNKVFDLRPTAIIRDLDLRKPIYRKLAAYGHMGRTDRGVRWEDTDRSDALLEAVK